MAVPAEGDSAPMVTENPASRFLVVLHFASPIIVFAVFLIAFTLHGILTSQPRDAATTSNGSGQGGKDTPTRAASRGPKFIPEEFSPVQKLCFNWLTVGLIFTFLANAVLVIVHAIIERPWWTTQSKAIYVVASFFVHSAILVSLVDNGPSPTIAHLVTWVSALLFELVILFASVGLYGTVHHENSIVFSDRRRGPSQWEIGDLVIDLVRVAFLVSLIGLFLVLRLVHRAYTVEPLAPEAGSSAESAGLLDNDHSAPTNANGHANGYGSVPGQSKDEAPQPPATDGWSRPTTAPSKSWWEYLQGYSLFFPYLWPAKSRRLQIVVVICFALVMLQRLINVLVPHQVGVVVDELSGENGAPASVPWGGICLYIFYRLMQGGTGFLGATRASLWIPVGQYSYQALSTSAFEHVHNLSLDFHIGKKTGEVLSALSKGSSINTFLEQVTFSVLPMLIDLCVAIGYFLVEFDAYYALVVTIITFSYMYVTIRMAQWRAEIRRQMVNASRDEDAVKNDSMVSYETVKYFNAETFEFNRYRNAVKRFQTAEYQVLFSLNLMNVVQNVVFTLGLLVVCFIAAYQVTTGQRKVGKFVSMLTYMAQLQGPLNYFGTFYRSIQSAMINSERMLELFKEHPTVVDKPDSKLFPSCEGEIRFDNVQFSYDSRKPALRGLTFNCAPGTTTALVGESGGGKSTVFRLLFRFYNVESGSVRVDGNDVSDITIDSLRRHIGVVPQDTILFNESLMYNLKYANQGVTDEQVYEACRAASIHDKILSFPDGYETLVGERGLRLSGGEKQRVAIARTILKDPRIILLDEATAALDSETEQHIQGALETLSKGRTMLVIAHRLSTITSADQILCLHEGQVVESGSHFDLLNKRGRYASMWKKQIRAERAAEQARVLNDRAEQLRMETTNGADSGNTSETEAEASSAAFSTGASTSRDTTHQHRNGTSGSDL
ncbi:MAG: hypothetical protein M4579_004144 [Chaenotheca gracillima]|nr:MAG: hypothetical protein M4579_004144 [Chaenotheca gracillima]